MGEVIEVAPEIEESDAGRVVVGSDNDGKTRSSVKPVVITPGVSPTLMAGGKKEGLSLFCPVP